MNEIEWAQTVAAEEEWMEDKRLLEEKQIEEDRMVWEENGIIFTDKVSRKP